MFCLNAVLTDKKLLYRPARDHRGEGAAPTRHRAPQEARLRADSCWCWHLSGKHFQQNTMPDFFVNFAHFFPNLILSTQRT